MSGCFFCCCLFVWGIGFKYLWSYKGKNSQSYHLVLIFFNDFRYKNTQIWKVYVIQYAVHVKFLNNSRRYLFQSTKLLGVCYGKVTIDSLGRNIRKVLFLFHKSSVASYERQTHINNDKPTWQVLWWKWIQNDIYKQFWLCPVIQNCTNDCAKLKLWKATSIINRKNYEYSVTLNFFLKTLKLSCYWL